MTYNLYYRNFVAVVTICLSNVLFLHAQHSEVSLERLVYTMSSAPSDIIPERIQPDKKLIFTEKLANYPNINEKLLGLIQIDAVDEPNSAKLSRSLYALSCRSDLTTDQLNRLLDIKSQIIVSDHDEIKTQYLCGLFPVLANYPNEEHENLILQYLQSDDPVVALNAASAIAKAGSSKSLPILEGVIEKRRAALSGYYDFIGDHMQILREKLAARLEKQRLINQISQPQNEILEAQRFGESTITKNKIGYFSLISLSVVFSGFFLRYYLRRKRRQRQVR